MGDLRAHFLFLFTLHRNLRVILSLPYSFLLLTSSVPETSLTQLLMNFNPSHSLQRYSHWPSSSLTQTTAAVCCLCAYSTTFPLCYAHCGWSHVQSQKSDQTLTLLRATSSLVTIWPMLHIPATQNPLEFPTHAQLCGLASLTFGLCYSFYLTPSGLILHACY